MAGALWAPDRRDYLDRLQALGHQPKSFDWRARAAKAHPWKPVPDDVFAAACERLNQIIAIFD